MRFFTHWWPNNVGICLMMEHMVRIDFELLSYYFNASHGTTQQNREFAKRTFTLGLCSKSSLRLADMAGILTVSKTFRQFSEDKDVQRSISIGALLEWKSYPCVRQYEDLLEVGGLVTKSAVAGNPIAQFLLSKMTQVWGFEYLPEDALRNLLVRVAKEQIGAADIVNVFAVSKYFQCFKDDSDILRAVSFKDFYQGAQPSYALFCEVRGLLVRCARGGHPEARYMLAKIWNFLATISTQVMAQLSRIENFPRDPLRLVRVAKAPCGPDLELLNYYFNASHGTTQRNREFAKRSSCVFSVPRTSGSFLKMKTYWRLEG